MTTSLYAARVTVTGGRDGRATSDDGLLDVSLALPQALGGSGKATNPEQLFAAGFGACFNSSVRHSGRKLGLDAGDVTIVATATLVAHDDGSFGLAVVLQASLPALAGEDRRRVLAEAERVCAYTNATRGNVDVVIRELEA